MTLALSRRRLLATGALALAAPQILPGYARAEATAFAPVAAPTYARTVGDLQVTALLDGYFPFEPAMFVNIAPEAVTGALTAARLDPAGPIRIGVTAHLVQGGGRTVLIDSGTADLFGPTLGRLPAAIAAAGVAPAQVDAVILTHMHPDHLGGLVLADAAAFPNASVHVSEGDLGFWTDEAIAAKAPAEAQPFFAAARRTAEIYGERMTTFTGEAEILPGISSVPLPGHTPGHSGVRLSSGDAQLLVWGDAASFAAVQFGNPEAGSVFDVDQALAAETRRKLFDMAAADDLLVAGTHLPFPGIGRVTATGSAFAWSPEEWQYQ